MSAFASVELTRAFVAADRFRGEESANLYRAAIAAGLLATGQAYGALAVATMVLVMAVVLRAGHAHVLLSMITLAIDTEVLVFLVDDPPLALMVACATLAVGLASLRLDARLVAGAAVLAWLGLRAQILDHRILSHGRVASALQLEHYVSFLVPLVVAAALGVGIVSARARRIAAHEKRASGSLPIDEQAGYRDPAAAGVSGVGVCARCHAPVIGEAKPCWLCRANVGGDQTVDASQVVARIFDPRVGRRRAIAAACIGTATGLAAFAMLAGAEGTPAILVTPAIFVVVALVPLLHYVRSAAARRGEMLVGTGVPGPIAAMLGVALGCSTLVLVLAAFGVVVTAICTAAGFPMR